MTKYNPDIHHRIRIRLHNYDYSQEGLYFVTICVQNREFVFGNIVNDKMILNKLGEIMQTIWNGMPQHYENVQLGEFVVMPNHIHGIIEIGGRGAIYRAQNNNCVQNNNRAQNDNCVQNDNVPSDEQLDAINRAPTATVINGGFAHEKNPMFHVNLPRIVRWLKGRTTFECRKINSLFAWQRNYFEHIIRDVNAHARIAEYIMNNPKKWNTDKFYIE